MWVRTHRACPFARELADRHYNRQSVGAKHFVPPGRCMVLYTSTETGRAFWVTSAPIAAYVRHQWAGAWVCSAFRNEGAARASDLITQAVAASRAFLGEPPALGMIAFVDPKHVRPTIIRGVQHWGWTYQRAGFRHVGQSKRNGLLAFQLLPADMPPAERAWSVEEMLG